MSQKLNRSNLAENIVSKEKLSSETRASSFKNSLVTLLSESQTREKRENRARKDRSVARGISFP